MNLNEQCLLNFLQNPNSLNDLTVLLGEYLKRKHSDLQNIEYNFINIVNE